MNIMLELQKNIELENFYNLLDLCFEVSTCFSFTENGVIEYAKSEGHKNFIKEFEPFLIKSMKVTHWHSYCVTESNKKRVYLYKSDKEAKRLIENNFDNLFLEERVNGDFTGIKDLPEDLCFFINDKLFLGTSSHAGICTAYPFSNEIYEALQRLGKWEKVPYSAEEQIILDL